MAETGPVLVAVDQGTSSTKTIVVDERGSVLLTTTVPLSAEHPAPGWVQQDADEILVGVRAGIDAALARFGDRVVAAGLSSQRESAIAWSTVTGRPLGPVLGWQDRRTIDRAHTLSAHAATIRRLSGLPLDPMFSALKFAHLLDEIDLDRSRSRAGEIALGTVDSWIVWALTGEHRIEVGNASRTQLLDIETADWSDELLGIFDVPREALPRIAASDEPTQPIEGSGSLRFTAILGDSHAALFGHGARAAGSVKVTYGTGSSIMGIEAAGANVDGAGLVRTVAWQTGGTVCRAFEGNILSTGATLVWLSEVLNSTPAELVELAEQSGPTSVDLVPAFAGLGAPWWDERATAVISGFDLGTSRAALARAAVESIPLQIEDVLGAADSGGDGRIRTILADGGPSANDWLVQLQADLSQRDVVRSDVAELSALGAAHLAGLTAGIWDEESLAAIPRSTSRFEPVISGDEASTRRSRWLGAVARSRSAALADETSPSAFSRTGSDRD